MVVLAFHKKAIYHGMVANQQRHLARYSLAVIDGEPVSSCLISRVKVVDFAKAGVEWWRLHGCHKTTLNSEYFYVREDLGVDPCGRVEGQSKQRDAVRYYRNTLLYIASLSYDRSALIQDTVAVPAVTSAACVGDVKRIKPGRQMLRWLW
jgi:hypothetical protein